MKKIPLSSLNAAWLSDTPAGIIGIAFDCPVCERFPHRLEIPLAHSPRWGRRIVYRYSGDLSDLSIFPTIIGELAQGGCSFKGWVKLGHVEHLHLDSRPVRRWEEVDFSAAPKSL